MSSFHRWLSRDPARFDDPAVRAVARIARANVKWPRRAARLETVLSAPTGATEAGIRAAWALYVLSGERFVQYGNQEGWSTSMYGKGKK